MFLKEIVSRIDSLDQMMKDLPLYARPPKPRRAPDRSSGLGLPTAKRLIEAHNGQIAVDCPPAAGTEVVIRLPMGAA